MRELETIGGTDNPDRRGDVVFVHGLNGDARASWQPPGKPDDFWPAWLHEDLSDIGVWAIGYPVGAFAWQSSTMPLADRAINALILLENSGVGSKPVVFVAHSLGGLLVKEMLRKGADNSVTEGAALVRHTRGVVFLATPHSGSNLADFVTYLKFLLPSVSVDELRTQEPRLRDLNTWYRNNVAELGIETQVYRESRKTPAGKDWIGRLVAVTVVDAVSSDPGLPGVTAVPMDDDHITISRPQRTGLLYTRVRRFVSERFTTEATPVQETIGPTPGGSTAAHTDKVTQDATRTDLPALLHTLNRLVPTQLGTLLLILNVPPEVMPGSSAPHGERVNALIAWARGPAGPGPVRVQEELEKIIHPR